MTDQWLSHVRNFVILISAIFFIACGGGGGGGNSDDGSGDNGSQVFSPRADNPNIPVEHSGTTQSNTRSYSANSNGYKVAILTSGLTDRVTLKLADEQIDINENVLTTFNSTFVDGTTVTVDIVEQPYLQICSFTGGVNSGMISADATLQLQLDCVDSNNPAPPFLTKIYCTSTDTIDIEWEEAVDRDTAANLISYTVYWSADRDAVENKTANSLSLTVGTLATQLTGLNADTEYFIAVEANDDNGNQSDLSDIRNLRTIATPNVPTGTPVYVLEPTDVSINGVTWTVPATAFSATPQVGNVLISISDTAYEFAKISALSLNSGSYSITTEPAVFGDVFEHLTISSDMGFSEAAKPITRVAPLFASNNQFQTFSVSYCRQDNSEDSAAATQGELTQEQLDQITLRTTRQFQPRVINKLVFSGGYLSPSLTGSIGFSGEVELGAKVGFQVNDKIEGVYSCKLAGFPKPGPTLRYNIPLPPTPFFIPIVQETEYDFEVKLSLSSEINVQAEAEAVARASLTAQLYYDPATGEWKTSTNAVPGLKADASLDVGQKMSMRAAIIPTVSTTLNKSLTAGVSADTGVNGQMDVSLVSENDPLFAYYGRPVALDDFTIDADVLFSFDANLSILGINFYTLPTWEFYQTEPLRLFDSPMVCTNEGATRKNCETEKNISGTDSDTEKRYPLQIHFVDGTFVKSFNALTNKNEIDLGSIDWHVSPQNGHIEVDTSDPTKATFVAYDDESYTIIASGHGVLGQPARKFAKFVTAAECTFGLGHELPEEYIQYRSNLDYFGSGYTNPILGYLFPEGLQVTDSEKDFKETCLFEADVEALTGQKIEAKTSVTFYAGQRNGKQTDSEKVYDSNNMLEYADRHEKIYTNGILKQRSRHTYQPQQAPIYQRYEKHHYYQTLTDAATGRRYLVETLNKQYMHDESGKRYLYVNKVDLDSLTGTIITYYPDGQLNGKYRYNIETPVPVFTVDINAVPILQIDSHITYIGFKDNVYYWPNGLLQLHQDPTAGIDRSCYWSPASNGSIQTQIHHDYDEREPNDIYHCRDY